MKLPQRALSREHVLAKKLQMRVVHDRLGKVLPSVRDLADQIRIANP